MLYSSKEGILIAGNRHADFASLHMFYDVGMKDDGEMPGLAHLCEHIIEMRSMNDGTFYFVANAFLSMEYTCFYARGFTDDIPQIYKLQSQLVASAIESVDESLVESEKKRILMENEAARKNFRRRSIMQLQEKIFGSGFTGQIDIIPETFSKIHLKDVKQFIEAKYCLRPCMVYSGFIGDIMPCAIQEENKSDTQKTRRKREQGIKSGLYQQNRFLCIAIETIDGIREYFRLKVLLEIYRLIWNTYYDEKIISTAVKLFDIKTLLIVEFKTELGGGSERFFKMEEADFILYFGVSVQKVKLDLLHRLHDLAAYNLFLYKAYRYLREVYVGYDGIAGIFANISAPEILYIHKKLWTKQDLLMNNGGCK